MATDLSVDALVAFLQLAGEKGWIPSSSAGIVRKTAERVFRVLDPDERKNVQTLDVEQAIRRFKNLNPAVSGASLQTYRGRIDKAIQSFVAYSSDPVNWRPDWPTRSAGGEGERAGKKNGSGASKPNGEKVTQVDQKEVHDASPPDHGLTYPFPLRPGITVKFVNVPPDLKSAECDRMAAFLRALAVDYQSKD